MAKWRDAFLDEGRSFSLVLLDLDHFKSINDTLGHKAGDEVLKTVADRLKRAIPTEHVVGRLGGDEFAILFVNGPGAGDTRSVVDRIVAMASGPLHVDGRRIEVAVSAGSAAIPGDCGSPDDLLSYADLALYAAKDAGRNCARSFDPAMWEAARMARDIEQDLARAIADRLLEVWYQPQVNLDSGRLLGLEALIRWHHPVHGWVPPPLVVAAARRIHASRSLTGFVIEEACGRLKQLARDGQDEVVLGINVSPSEIGLYDLEQLLTGALAAHGIDPRRFEVEITEEALLASEGALATLKSLSAQGVRLAIDDFGTGCSSIAYLRRLRADRIKIDRCFVTGFDTREDDRILVQTIIGIGRSFGIEVVAEGVETAADAALLRRFGCTIGQGFHFGRPARFDDRGGALRTAGHLAA